MGDHRRAECLTMEGVRRACKSFLSKRHRRKRSSLANNLHPQHNHNHLHQVVNKNGNGNGNGNGNDNGDEMQESGISPRVSLCGYYSTPKLSRTASTGLLPSNLSRNSSQRRSKTPSRSGPMNLLSSLSRKSMDLNSFQGGSIAGPSPSLSRRNSSTIMYSNSNGLVKPPDMVKRLDCTLDDLCFGCIKKVNIKRDVLTDDGQIIQEEEVLTIKVKPGWRKGTKITFEGMGNETPGTHPADVTVVIDEKPHPVFKRHGDNLELAVELPLVDALTGCTIPIPLLNNQQLLLTIDDIISPGYTKTIAGQGMVLPKEQGKRGNLIVKFSVQFPHQLTQEQRSEVSSILQDSC